MKNKRILSLILGAIIASGSISQVAIQVYADLEESSLSELESISESISESPEVMNLTKMTDLSGTKIGLMIKSKSNNINKDSLYISENSLIFEPVTDNEAKLVCYDGNEPDVIVPQTVAIDDNEYSVTSIGSAAFADNYTLESVNLPESVIEIGNDAFFNCKNLQLTELPDGITEIGTLAFAGCTNFQLTKLPEGITEVAEEAFAGCTNLQLTKLPEGVTKIEHCAFSDCINLQLTELPNSITEIGAWAFSDCTNLQLTKLPEGITEIGAWAFSGTNIKKITITASVIELDENSFETNTIKEINVEPGSQLTYEDIMLACGKYSSQVRVTGIEIPPKPVFKMINNLDELIGQNDEYKCPLCFDDISIGDEVADLPCNPHVHHYMHKDCFESFVQNLQEQELVSFSCPECRQVYLIEDLY